MDKVTEIEKQYDKIYRYCYFRLRSRELAEDITQETFLKFLESTGYRNRGKSLQYLYTMLLAELLRNNIATLAIMTGL